MGWSLVGSEGGLEVAFSMQSMQLLHHLHNPQLRISALHWSNRPGKNLLETILRDAQESNEYFALGNTTLSKPKPLVRKGKRNWSIDHTVPFLQDTKSLTLFVPVFSKLKILFLSSLTFLALKYKLSREKKLRKHYKSKASIQIWLKQFQIIWIRSAVCSPSFFWFTFLKPYYLSEFGTWKSSVSCFRKALSAMQQKTWQCRNLLFLWDH